MNKLHLCPRICLSLSDLPVTVSNSPIQTAARFLELSLISWQLGNCRLCNRRRVCAVQSRGRVSRLKSSFDCISKFERAFVQFVASCAILCTICYNIFTSTNTTTTENIYTSTVSASLSTRVRKAFPSFTPLAHSCICCCALLEQLSLLSEYLSWRKR
jgi:hypothetical protein